MSFEWAEAIQAIRLEEYQGAIVTGLITDLGTELTFGQVSEYEEPLKITAELLRQLPAGTKLDSDFPEDDSSCTIELAVVLHKKDYSIVKETRWEWILDVKEHQEGISYVTGGTHYGITSAAIYVIMDD